jgi:L-cysteine/cystine lyase
LDLPRSAFPALQDDSYAYLNSGGSGPPSHETLRAMREAEDLFAGAAYGEGVGLFARQREANERARAAAARLVGAPDGSVALTLNTSHGMSLGAAALDWREGDEIVTASSEHPGCLVPLHASARRHGAEVRLVEPPVTVEKVAEAMSARTRLVALSHVDWNTGEVLPLAEISALAREHGALTLVDGAQSVGNIAVDVPALGVDLYAFTGHKWVLGPEGMGALYVRPGLAGELWSTNLGYGSVEDPTTFSAGGGYALHAGARRFEGSTTSPTLAVGFAAAAEAVSERGAEGFQSIRRRADRLMGLLSEVPGVKIRSQRPAGSGLVSFEVAGVASAEASEKLLARGLVVRHLPEPYPYVRASTHLFNGEDELVALAEAVGGL